ncbi:Cell division control protein 3 [Binucleata daphniae]
MKDAKIPTIYMNLGKIDADPKIGLGNIPNLIRERSKIQGFYINLLVVGRRGLGTSTLINSLFCSPLIDKDRNNGINTYKNQVYENEIYLNTSITTYHQDQYEPIMNFFLSKNQEYFEIEQGLTKPKIDGRIHLCLYLIPSDELKESEKELIKEISKMCNLIPIISKADSYTATELNKYKEQINNMLNEVQIFYPSLNKEDDDLEMLSETSETIAKYPLAIFASTDTYEHNGVLKKGRMYNWGFLDIENEDFNDFLKLRRLVIHNCLDELIYTTDTIFYNEYRKTNMEYEKFDETLGQCKKRKENASKTSRRGRGSFPLLRRHKLLRNKTRFNLHCYAKVSNFSHTPPYFVQKA